MPNKPRLTAIESLRGIAFMAVVLQHSIAHYAYVPGVTFTDGIVMSVLLMLSKFAVPAFIFITGMVLFYNYEDRFASRTFLKRRVTDIFLPYILWSVIYICFNIWRTSGPAGFYSFDIGKSLLQLLTGKSSYHLWYIIMIMQLYLLFPFIRIAILKLKNKYKETTLLLLLLIMGVVYLILMYYRGRIGEWAAIANIPGITPWFTTYADRNVLFFFFYFLLGAAAGLYPNLWQSIVWKSRMVMIPLFILFSGYYVYELSSLFLTPEGLKINFNRVSLLRPDMALYLVISLFVCYLAAMLLPKGFFSRALAVMGSLSFGAYLMHALMLVFSYQIEKALYSSWSVTLQMLMTFLIASLLSLGMTRLIAFFKVGKWIVGIHIPLSKKNKL
ncbi:acyltransferase [Paenibacillus sp. Marseille-Q4541]|uniref:acyltransferase n=1 Tax=Paenibacillus sp. Marseille-Q4541 TaxID=2831522 RepID=UPI001BAD78AF